MWIEIKADISVTVTEAIDFCEYSLLHTVALE